MALPILYAVSKSTTDHDPIVYGIEYIVYTMGYMLYSTWHINIRILHHGQIEGGFLNASQDPYVFVVS